MTTLKTLALGLNRFLSRLFSDDPETIDYLNGADSLPPPLNKEEEKKAFELLETDPKKARELLIVHNLRLVVYIAKKFESTGTGIEDLISIGSIGLIKAVNTFCPHLHRHHRPHQGHQHLPQRQEHQARDLCFTVHRKRDTYVS